MILSSHGFILSVTKHTENGRIIRCFLKNHGIISGFLDNNKNKATNQVLTSGSLVKARWHSKLSENLGRYKIEQESPYDIHLIVLHKYKNILLSNAIHILIALLPEREPQNLLWHSFYRFMISIDAGDDLLYLLYCYTILEIYLLYYYKHLKKYKIVELIASNNGKFNHDAYNTIIAKSDLKKTISNEMLLIFENTNQLLKKHANHKLIAPYIREMLRKLLLEIQE